MFALNIDESSRDIILKYGEAEWVNEYEELLQEIRTVLKTNTNEWFLDPLLGLNYDALVGKNVDDNEIEIAVRRALDQIDRISSVDRISIDRDKARRKLLINIKATAGDLDVDEVMEF